MNKRLIIANWKMNPDSGAKARVLAEDTERCIAPVRDAEVVIAPPYPFLRDVAPALVKAVLGAQDVFWEGSGAYTGEVSVRQLQDAGVSYVIVGHSERRAIGETDEMVHKKTRAALEGGLGAILCVGEDTRSGNVIPAAVGAQVRSALTGVKKALLKKLVIAYEPVWAISTSGASAGPCTPDMIFQARLVIEKTIADIYDPGASKIPRIIYGGSVSPDTIVSVISAGHMDGALVGSASLNAETFGRIVRNAAEAV